MNSYMILKRIRLVYGLSYENVTQETGILPSQLEKIEEGHGGVINSALTKYYAKYMKINCNLLCKILQANDGEFGSFCQSLSNLYSGYLLCILRLRDNDASHF